MWLSLWVARIDAPVYNNSPCFNWGAARQLKTEFQFIR